MLPQKNCSVLLDVTVNQPDEILVALISVHVDKMGYDVFQCVEIVEVLVAITVQKSPRSVTMTTRATIMRIEIFTLKMATCLRDFLTFKSCYFHIRVTNSHCFTYGQLHYSPHQNCTYFRIKLFENENRGCA